MLNDHLTTLLHKEHPVWGIARIAAVALLLYANASEFDATEGYVIGGHTALEVVLGAVKRIFGKGE